MRTPEIFLAYAPRAGLRCAIAYLGSHRDAYGWFAGPAEGAPHNAYFVLEGYYSQQETRYLAVPHSEFHSTRMIEEDRWHELAQLQEAFSREWLFNRGDAGADVQLREYARAELATGDMNIRFERLNRFSKLQPNWTYYSPHFEHGVLECLASHWPLDYPG